MDSSVDLTISAQLTVFSALSKEKEQESSFSISVAVSVESTAARAPVPIPSLIRAISFPFISRSAAMQSPQTLPFLNGIWHEPVTTRRTALSSNVITERSSSTAISGFSKTRPVVSSKIVFIFLRLRSKAFSSTFTSMVILPPELVK